MITAFTDPFWTASLTVQALSLKAAQTPSAPIGKLCNELT